MTITVLTCYPLSARVATQFTERREGELRFLTLSSLRALPLRELWRTLRVQTAEEARAVVAEPSERVMLPILLMLCAFMPARRITMLDLSRGEVKRVPRMGALLGVAASIVATLSGHWQRHLIGLRARRLIRAAPLRFPLVAGNKGLYLKTNLMLGTNAGGSVGHIAGIVNELHRRNPGLLVQALEFPATAHDDIRFEPLAGFRAYGLPPESNQLRFNGSAIRGAAAALRRERFDFIYQRMSLANLAGVVLSRRFRVPLVLEYNGSEVWVSRHWGLPLKWERLAERIEQVCLRHAMRVVTVSDALADELVARGVAPDRIVNYPNCIDPEVFDPDKYQGQSVAIRNRLGFAPSDVICTFLGTFGAWHGADVLAEAIRRYLAEPLQHRAPRLRFLMIGDGLHAPACRDLLADSVAVGDVVFTGIVPQAETPAYLAASNVFLSPHVRPADGSRFFGSPTKLFEYMAMARPIIASALEQIADVLSPGATIQFAMTRDAPEAGTLALLTEPGSVDDIVAALILLRDREAWRGALGPAAREKVLSTYTWRQHVDEILASLGQQGQ